MEKKMKKALLLSIAASCAIFADSDIEELKKLVREQQVTIQALQKRVETLEQTHTAASSKVGIPVQPHTTAPSKADTTLATATPSKPHKPKRSRAPQQAKPQQPKAEQVSYASAETPILERPRSEEEEMTVFEDSSSSFDQSAFLPGIALIGNMSALGRNIDNELYGTYAIPGFIGEAGEIPFNPNKGFNLNYGELELFSTIGPYLDMFAALHIEKEGLHIGELFVTTRTLPYGLQAKAGKFRSDFGRINIKHQHAWSFSNIPLVFETFFGAGGLGDEGVQLQWVTPSDIYLMAGVEAMQGNNPRSFGDTDDGANLMIGYLKGAVDLSDATTMLAGLTYMQGKDGFGDTKIYGADLTFKTSFDSYSGLKWQNELLYREKPLEGGFTADQGGLYSELIYDYNQNWSGGVRYDMLFKNIPDEPEPLDRYTAMIQYKPFEFTKLRLQYTYDKSKYFGGEQKNIQEIMLDLTFEAGAHGAHAF